MTGPVVVPRCAASTPRWQVGCPTRGCCDAGWAPSGWRRGCPGWPMRLPARSWSPGVAGGLDPSLRPGDVVVATEVRDQRGRTVLRGAAPLAAELRRMGLRVRTGPVISCDHLVGGARERERLAATGALAADMESAAVVRATARHADRRRPRRSSTPRSRRCSAWPRSRPGCARCGCCATPPRRWPGGPNWSGARRVLLAEPRSFCAGVERAIDIVKIALQRQPHPVYVRRQIVHNSHVVADLERQGAVFVDELDQVPDGTTVVFSAHGVAPAVRAEADRRGLNVIDATCPLVAKVHTESRRFVGRGDTVLLIGHAGHDETEGTLGEAPGRIRLVAERGGGRAGRGRGRGQGGDADADDARRRRGGRRRGRAAAQVPPDRVLRDRRHLLRDHQSAAGRSGRRRGVRRRARGRLDELVATRCGWSRSPSVAVPRHISSTTPIRCCRSGSPRAPPSASPPARRHHPIWSTRSSAPCGNSDRSPLTCARLRAKKSRSLSPEELLADGHSH